MYTLAKKILTCLLPHELLFMGEPLFRKLYALLYIGRAVYCNVCKRHLSRFVPVYEHNNICPRCGSIDRHRRLWQIIHNECCFSREDRILDFSPSRHFLRLLKKEYPHYVSSNYQKNSLTDKNYDITAIPEPDHSFDRIICYHVLEHIENDLKAMEELYRILTHDGCAIIQTPFSEGEMVEYPEVTDAAGRLKHYGQADHVRIYSVNSLKERLESVGFSVTLLEYHEEKNNFYGFKLHETVLIARKP